MAVVFDACVPRCLLHEHRLLQREQARLELLCLILLGLVLQDQLHHLHSRSMLLVALILGGWLRGGRLGSRPGGGLLRGRRFAWARLKLGLRGRLGRRPQRRRLRRAGRLGPRLRPCLWPHRPWQTWRVHALLWTGRAMGPAADLPHAIVFRPLADLSARPFEAPRRPSAPTLILVLLVRGVALPLGRLGFLARGGSPSDPRLLQLSPLLG